MFCEKRSLSFSMRSSATKGVLCRGFFRPAGAINVIQDLGTRILVADLGIKLRVVFQMLRVMPCQYLSCQKVPCRVVS